MGKIGRNAPCPCGSGKKFKHCHMGREDEIFPDGMSEISVEMSLKITRLPAVNDSRCREMIDLLPIETLTGKKIGVKFIDLAAYHALGIHSGSPFGRGKGGTGGVLVNPLKTAKGDPNNLYVALSPRITDSALVHQLAHVLDYLGGSGLMPGFAKPLSFDLEIPVEHLEHPHEFGYWLSFLKEKFHVQLDADDTIIQYLYENGMLIKGELIGRQDRFLLKSKSETILKFLHERSAEIDAMIRERHGYIGSRTKEA